MPLPNSTIGPNNFNPILGAQQQTNESSRFAYGNLAKLGQTIADSISIQNMRKEAQEAAPTLAQAYGQGLGAIQQGDIAGGLQHIYQTNAQYAANPLLSQIGHQATVGAGLIAQDQIVRGHQQAQFGQQAALAGQRVQSQEDQQARQFQHDDAKTQYIQGQENARAGITGVGRGNLTANERIKAVEGFNKMADESLSDLDSGDPEKFLGAYEKYANLKGTLVKAGAYVDMPHYDKVAHEKLDELNKKLEGYASKIDSGKGEDLEGWIGSRQKISDIVKQIKEQKDRIIKANKRALADGFDFPDQQPAFKSSSSAPSGLKEGTTATGPGGQKLIYQGGQWQPAQ